jgi:hypothetical protein
MVKPYTPHVLTANTLLDGDVVFLGPAGWVGDLRDAIMARTPDEATALEAKGAAAKAARLIIDPYLVEVALEPDGALMPLRFRERLRTLGPTVRTDLGKQAPDQDRGQAPDQDRGQAGFGPGSGN